MIAATLAFALALVHPPAAAPEPRLIGPQASAAAYVEARGGFSTGVALDWKITSAPLEAGFEAEGEPVGTRTVIVGDGYAFEPGAEGGPLLLDFRMERRVRIDPGAAGFTNGSVYADIRRRLDIYAALSGMGQAARVELAGESFDRFWLEAAMGVAATDAALEIRQQELGPRFLRDGAPIAELAFSAGFDCPTQGLGDIASRSTKLWLRHALPLHPDAFAAIASAARPPCEIRFAIISPESPQGRIETWRLSAARSVEAPAPFPEDSTPSWPDAPRLPDDLGAVLAAAESADTMDKAAYFERVDAARARGDIAEALLLSEAEQLRFGPCPEMAIGGARLTCAILGDVRRAAQGDPAAQAVLAGLDALEAGDAAEAAEALASAGDHDGLAGAALRARLAEAALALGPQAMRTRPDLDPVALLVQALRMDPKSGELYGRLAQRYLAAGAPEAAWALYDAARAADGVRVSGALAEAAQTQARMRRLVPDFFPDPAVENAP